MDYPNNAPLEPGRRGYALLDDLHFDVPCHNGALAEAAARYRKLSHQLMALAEQMQMVCAETRCAEHHQLRAGLFALAGLADDAADKCDPPYIAEKEEAA